MFDKQVQDEIRAIAEHHDLDPNAMLAIAEVESAGRPWWVIDGKNHPPIRFEGHYMHRILAREDQDALNKAVAAGLAHPRAGGVKNPNSYRARYQMLERAKAIDEQAAIRSCSWGLGQVMGEHAADFGLTPKQFEAKAFKSIAGQVELMILFIDKNGLRKYIKALDFDGFAYRYNGPAYKKNRYAHKMRAAYARYSGGTATASNSTLGLQQDLAKLGYSPGPLDGIMGLKTIEAVRRFQNDHGLIADGDAGPLTRKAMDEALAVQAKNSAQGKKGIATVGMGVTGAGGINAETAGKIVNTVSEQEASLNSGDWIKIAIGVAIIGIAVWAAFGPGRETYES